MSESLTALASENLNPSLRSLLEDVVRGHIRVPRFQRPFVWSDSQRLDLLRSVRDNMPIGSLLVWRTIKFKLASFPTVGPHLIPPIIDKAPATGWQYLLDGHQRVSTLLGLLLPPEPLSLENQLADEAVIDWDIQYDLMENDFVFGRIASKKSAKRPLLPLWTLFDGRLVNKHMRELRRRAKSEGWTEGNLDAWDVLADQLSYRFQQCRIPIVVMVTDDLELAAKTFQRINSLGTPMNEAHFVAALTWSSDFDLRERVADLRDTLPSGWRNIDEAIYLQVCKGLSGLDMTKAGQNELVKKLTDDKTLLDRAGAGLMRAVDWLVANAAIANQELLPYAFQLVLLAVEVDRLTGKQLFNEGVLGWFWRTSWSGVFGTGAYRQIKSEQEQLRNAAGNIADDVTWSRDQALPERFDFRSARVRLMMLRLALHNPVVDANGRPEDGRSLLLNHGREAFGRLFPALPKASPTLRQLFQGAGNRFLVDPSDQPILKERLLKGPDLSDEALAAHFVDSEALAALRAGDFETFLHRRAKVLDAWDSAQWKSEQEASKRRSEIYDVWK